MKVLIRAADLEELVVHPAHRGKGIAKVLLKEAKTRAAALGASCLQLRVWAFNKTAAELYRSLGFETRWSEMEYQLPKREKVE